MSQVRNSRGKVFVEYQPPASSFRVTLSHGCLSMEHIDGPIELKTLRVSAAGPVPSYTLACEFQGASLGRIWFLSVTLLLPFLLVALPAAWLWQSARRAGPRGGRSADEPKHEHNAALPTAAEGAPATAPPPELPRGATMADIRASLPADLVAFFERRGELDYDADDCECGRVALLPLARLTLGEVGVDSPGPGDSRGASERVTTHRVPAINLIASAEDCEGEFVLCWLPTVGVFANADTEHNQVTVFPGVTWTQIAADPARYLNAQWEGGWTHLTPAMLGVRGERGGGGTL